MAVRYYRGTFVPYEQGFSVAFPDFPGCVTAGDTLQHAVAQAEEALSLHVEGMTDDQDPIPDPSELGAPLPQWMAEAYAETGDTFVEQLVRVELPGRTVRVNVTMPEDVLANMDRDAKRQGMTRSGYLAHLVRDARRREQQAA